jgi:hypothetical protein
MPSFWIEMARHGMLPALIGILCVSALSKERSVLATEPAVRVTLPTEPPAAEQQQRPSDTRERGHRFP